MGIRNQSSTCLDDYDDHDDDDDVRMKQKRPLHVVATPRPTDSCSDEEDDIAFDYNNFNTTAAASANNTMSDISNNKYQMKVIASSGNDDVEQQDATAAVETKESIRQHHPVSQSPTSVIPKRKCTDPTFPTSSPTNTDDVTDTDPTIPSSEDVLNVAFYSFIGFMLVQGFVAKYIAHSSAMMADCEAMSVDALTYLFNLFAEQQKNRPYTQYELQHRTLEQRVRRREFIKYYYEFIPPTLSVVTLILVTIYTIHVSITTICTITTDTIRTANAKNDTVSIPIMLLFSFVNLILDLVNVSCFTRSGFVNGVVQGETKSTTTNKQQQQSCCPTPVIQQQPWLYHTETSPLLIRSGSSDMMIEDVPSTTTTITATKNMIIDESTIHTTNTISSHEVNLNMCSAWTHICADTMRSTAVLLAAGIAMCIPTTDVIEQQYYATMADSIAALAVSIIILLSMIPLLQALYHTGQQIIQLHCTPCSTSSSTGKSSYHTIDV